MMSLDPSLAVLTFVGSPLVYTVFSGTNYKKALIQGERRSSMAVVGIQVFPGIDPMRVW